MNSSWPEHLFQSSRKTSVFYYLVLEFSVENIILKLEKFPKLLEKKLCKNFKLRSTKLYPQIYCETFHFWFYSLPATSFETLTSQWKFRFLFHRSSWKTEQSVEQLFQLAFSLTDNFLIHFLSYLFSTQQHFEIRRRNRQQQCLPKPRMITFLFRQIAFNCSYMMFKILVC